jgi:predicted outer membrane repeat protein
VLSGDIESDDTTNKDGVVVTTTNIVGDNSFHVVTGSGMTSTAVLDGFTITAGQANGGIVYPCDDQCGGGMYNYSGSPTMANVNFSGNSAASGGGMYNITNSSPVLDNVTFSGNSADSSGGGIFNNESSNPLLTDVTFTGNSADWAGGMYNSVSSPSLVEVSFTGNSADWGGGIYNGDSTPVLTNVTFISNTADYGGGMFNVTSNPTIAHVTFISNTAYENGGGMYNNDSSPSLIEVNFTNNSATYYGGGMNNNKNSSPTLAYVTFISNTADVGGGMYNIASSDPLIKFSTFFSNSSSSGGGMSNWDSSPSLTNVILSGNVSDDEGGGMSNFSSSPELMNVAFSGNSAATSGGGISNDDSNLILTNVTFSGNSAGWDGGGIYNGLSSLSMRNSILWNNQDSSGTGTISATIFNASSAVTLTHSLAQGTGGSASWTTDVAFVDAGGNLDTEPYFRQDVDASAAPTTNGDLRLEAESPAINTGDDQYVTGMATDLDGNPRISGGTVDMGAYEFQYYTLTVSLAGLGGGSVYAGGFSCGTDCIEIYADSTVVTLTAQADTGSTFAGWSGACTNSTGDCVVKMTEAKVVTATFTLNQYTLSLSLLGTGGGKVTSDPVGIACSSALDSDCDQIYDFGTVVTLTEAADPGSTFTGWSGACSGKDDCVLTMTDPFSVTARFNSLDVYLPLVSR